MIQLYSSCSASTSVLTVVHSTDAAVVKSAIASPPVAAPDFSGRYALRMLPGMIRQNFVLTVKNVYFAVIVFAGALFLLSQASVIGSRFGTNTYPVTYQVLDFTQTKTSRQLSYLKNAGLVNVRRLDNWMYYFLKEEAAAGGKTKAGAVFNEGDVLVPKIANIKLFADASDTAKALATLGKADELVVTGVEKNGFIAVQGATASGWVKIVLVQKR